MSGSNFSFESLLPVLAGAALTGMTGGAAAPLVAGELGGETAATGIGAGLLADGTSVLAGLPTELSSFGALAPYDYAAAAESAVPEVAQAAAPGIMGGMSNIGLTQGAGLSQAAQAVGQAGLDTSPAAMNALQAGQAVGNVASTGGSGVMDAFKQGASSAWDMAKEAESGIKAHPYLSLAGAGLTSAGLQALNRQTPPQIANYKSKLAVRDPNAPRQAPIPPANPYQADYTQFQNAAEGGLMHGYDNGGITEAQPQAPMQPQAQPQVQPQQDYLSQIIQQTSPQAFQAQQGAAQAQATPRFANGGIAALANQGQPQGMPQPQQGLGSMFPQSQQMASQYATPSQMPVSSEMLSGYEVPTNTYTGEPVKAFSAGGQTEYQKSLMLPPAHSSDETDPDFVRSDAYSTALGRMAKIDALANMDPQYQLKAPAALGSMNLTPAMVQRQRALAAQQTQRAAAGGIMGADQSTLGGYAAGGMPRLLKGPGDGMSDNIPAVIGQKQPARLADGEFVIPADVVSHLGNGSTDAGAKHLHTMMDNVRKARTGNPKQGKQINPAKFLQA